MPEFNQVHQEGETKFSQMVGSGSLADAFKRDGGNGRIRGSFSLNHREFTNFEADSPEGVVAQINRYASRTGVRASLNESGALVLDHNSPQDIHIGLGKAYEEPLPAGLTSAADIAKYNADREERERENGVPENDVLQLLGLTESEPVDGAVTIPVTAVPDGAAGARPEALDVESQDKGYLMPGETRMRRAPVGSAAPAPARGPGGVAGAPLQGGDDPGGTLSSHSNRVVPEVERNDGNSDPAREANQRQQSSEQRKDDPLSFNRDPQRVNQEPQRGQEGRSNAEQGERGTGENVS